MTVDLLYICDILQINVKTFHHTWKGTCNPNGFFTCHTSWSIKPAAPFYNEV